VIIINLIPDSERIARKEVKEVEVVSVDGKKKIDWLDLAPKILGGLLGLLMIIYVVFIFFPNLSRGKRLDILEQKWKKLEPDYKILEEKKKEEEKYIPIVDEFYRFVDERVIWSQLLNILSTYLPPDIQFIRLSAKSELKNYDSVEIVESKDDKGKVQTEEKTVQKQRLVHVIVIKGLVPVDAQGKVVDYKRKLEKDEFLKNMIKEITIPQISQSSQNSKTFTMEIYLNPMMSARE
jgi:hypothetical protein